MNVADKKVYKVNLNQKVGLLAERNYFWDPALRCANTLCTYAWLKEDCRLDAFEYAWNVFLKYNDCNRLRFFGKIVKKQYIADYEYEKLPQIEVNSEEEFNTLLDAETRRCFVLNEKPAYYVVLVKGKGSSGGIIILTHHILSDGYTQSIMMEQIEKAYFAFINGEDYVPDTASYTEYLEHELKFRKSPAAKRMKRWWKEECAKNKDVYIPCGHKALRSDSLTADFEVAGDYYRRLKKFCSENNFTVPAFISTVAAITAARLTGKLKLPLFNLSHGRTTFKLKKACGFMVNTVPVLFKLEPEKNFKELTKAYSVHYLASLSNSQLPLFYYIFYSFWISLRNGMNFYHSWLILNAMEIGNSEENSSLNLKCSRMHSLNSVFNLGIYDIPNAEKIRFDLDYQKYKYSNEKVWELIGEFLKTLETVLDDTERPIGELFKI